MRPPIHRRRRLLALAAVVLLASAGAVPLLQETDGPPRFQLINGDLAEGMPVVIASGARYRGLTVHAVNSEGEVLETVTGSMPMAGFEDDAGNAVTSVTFENGVATLPPCHQVGPLSVNASPLENRIVGGAWSIIAPLVAIILAILLREVLLALLIGCWAGVIAIEGELLAGTLRTFDRHIINALADVQNLHYIKVPYRAVDDFTIIGKITDGPPPCHQKWTLSWKAHSADQRVTARVYLFGV